MLQIDTKTMGEKLIKLRGNRTQEEVSEALGISKSALSMYETGKRIPRDPVKMKLARYNKKSVPYIILNEKDHEK